MTFSQTFGQLVGWFAKHHHVKANAKTSEKNQHSSSAKAFYCPKEQQAFEHALEQQRAERDTFWGVG